MRQWGEEDPGQDFTIVKSKKWSELQFPTLNLNKHHSHLWRHNYLPYLDYARKETRIQRRSRPSRGSKIDPTTSFNATTHHFTSMLIVYGRFKLYNILQGLIFYIFILKSPHSAPCEFSIHSNPAHDVFHLGRREFHASYSVPYCSIRLIFFNWEEEIIIILEYSRDLS
jgi:hypothetical protein